MTDRRASTPFAARRALTPQARGRSLPYAYKGRAGRRLPGLYDDDHAETRQSGRFRWLVSTCLGAAVGATAILVVIYGSSDPKGDVDGVIPALRRITEQVEDTPAALSPSRAAGLAWAVPRSDRLIFTDGALTTRYLIQDSVMQRRADRDYIKPKPYTRIVARLAPVDADSGAAAAIPPFNPFKLYAANQAPGAASATNAARTDIVARVVELIGGVLPAEDEQTIDDREIAEIVAKTRFEEAPLDLADGGAPPPAQAPPSVPAEAATPALTTDVAKSGGAEDDALEGAEVRGVKVGQGDTLETLLTRAGAEPWLAREMIEAAAGVFAERSLAPGHELRITLTPSPTQAERMEPVRFSVLAAGRALVTVARSEAGQFMAQTDQPGAVAAEKLPAAAGDQGQASSVYAGLFGAAASQGLLPETILGVMRVHAYETDFRRRIRPGDTAEFFFDTKEGAGMDDDPGELLYTSISAGGETRSFYRFRGADNKVDYYDENGVNSKRFLNRKPVQSSDVRFVSGFGMRFHPLLNVRRMHTGVDWASAIGTPILAAGNGVIEEAGRKGGYGNYVRIRHANGYQTAYGHLSRFAAETAVGAKVRQGQTIGTVGCTGLCQGPHVHFEVLVNNRFVDPLSIQVPNEKLLKGRELQDFNKERARIEGLMRRPPVNAVSK